MNKFIIAFIGFIVIVAAGWFLFSSGPSPESAISPAPSSSGQVSGTPASFDQAPLFSLNNYDGNTVSLADFSGKKLLVNSWAVWCPFCRKELKDFAQIQKEFGDEIVIIAIDRAESLTTAKKYTDELGVSDDLVFLLDPRDSFYQSIGGFGMPETIFVDEAGVILFHKRGPMDLNEIRQRIKETFSI